MHMTNSKNGRFAEKLGKLRVEDHPCLIYESLAEKIAVVAPFIRIGFERGERCLIFSQGTKIDSLMNELASAGIDTADALARGTLYLPDIHDIYGRDEPFDGERVFDFLDRAIKEAKTNGHTGLRLIGDMTWALEGTSGPEPLIEYEARLNDFICSHDLPALCMYDRNLFPPEVLLDVLRTHPHVIYGNTVTKSDSYQTPQDFFRPERANIELDNFLHVMLSNEEIITALRARLTLLDAVIENSPDIIYVKDLEGRFLMINPAGATIFGKTVEEILGRTASEFMSAGDAAAIIETDRKSIDSNQTLRVELTYTTAGVTRTFLAIKGGYRDAKGDLIGIFGISRDITELKRSAQENETYLEQLRLLATQLSTVEEQERRRIATALHDKIGQSLALANIKLGSLKDMERDSDLWKEIDKIRELLDDAIRHTRSLTMELSPSCLYELGLEDALQSICEKFQSEHGIKISFKYYEAIQPFDNELRVILYHGVRELLVNIVKHAQANSVDISVDRDGDYIRMTVKDDGIGFDYNAYKIRSLKERGFGLFNLSERLKCYGGRFDIESNPGHGTRVTLVAPLVTEQKEMPGN